MERKPMYTEFARPLTFEVLLNDPLTRMVMEADGVSADELADILHAACAAMATRRRPVVTPVAAVPRAMSVPA